MNVLIAESAGIVIRLSSGIEEKIEHAAEMAWWFFVAGAVLCGITALRQLGKLVGGSP